MFSRLALRDSAAISKWPASWRADTASRIPKKNNTLAESIFLRTPTTESLDLSSIFFSLCKISVKNHIAPKDSIIPMKGGKWVTVLKNGTKSSPKTPQIKTMFLSTLVFASPVFSFSTGLLTSPFNLKDMIPRGTNIATIDGIIRFKTIIGVVSWPPIQSIVVVTSPIGDQAPPALAEIITIPAKIHLVSLSLISFLNKEIITIDVVRLSSTAEKKKVIMQIIQSSLTLLLVFILSVITLNPSLASTSSTIVMAPKRKNRILEISSMWWKSLCS